MIARPGIRPQRMSSESISSFDVGSDLSDQDQERPCGEVPSVVYSSEVPFPEKWFADLASDGDVDSLLVVSTPRHLRTFFFESWLILTALLFSVGVGVTVICILFSYYGIILLHFVLFVSLTISALMSPLFYGLASDWIAFAASLVLLLEMCPFIQFFSWFMAVSSMTVIDLIQNVPTMLRLGIESVGIFMKSERHSRDGRLQRGLRSARHASGGCCSLPCWRSDSPLSASI
jgi:hypothetical protein